RPGGGHRSARLPALLRRLPRAAAPAGQRAAGARPATPGDPGVEAGARAGLPAARLAPGAAAPDGRARALPVPDAAAADRRGARRLRPDATRSLPRPAGGAGTADL